MFNSDLYKKHYPIQSQSDLYGMSEKDRKNWQSGFMTLKLMCGIGIIDRLCMEVQGGLRTIIVATQSSYRKR